MNMLQNREEAARLLAGQLARYKGQEGVVLAIPRGGVPIAAVIARHLGMPLDVALSKKIGHPANPEFAIGCVSLETVKLDERPEVPRTYIEAQIQEIRQNLRHKYKLYRGNRRHAALANKLVIIVDDGVATGNTLLATIALVQKQQPRRVVVAVPVAPAAAIPKLASMVDEVICLLVPPYFESVGQFYREFDQVSNQEVVALLQEQEPG